MDEKKEIDEAVNAANDALYHLGLADELLQSAKNWGIADILGGKFFVTAMKRSKMSDAQMELQAAQTALNTLAAELRDVNMYFDFETTFDGFLGVADYMFDNLVTDIMAQSRINQARAQVQDAIEQVEGILDALDEIAQERGYF